jgi:short-subunit dehydrogenase
MLPTLSGAAALLTGGSQGLGPVIARALAAEGVRLALVARSADKLGEVARQLRGAGASCVAIAADITGAADRARLVAEATGALGPIDILVNNAGAEIGGRFVRRTPVEIEQLVATNVTAPMLLTREVLPGMLARRRGHVINIASIAGKLGYPYAAVYGGTKAAILAWSGALRLELEGSGVSVSVVSPGYVKDVGMFAAHYRTPPRALGETTSAAVAQGVVKALRTDPIEVVVTPRPFWPVQALYAAAPTRVLGLMRRLGVIGYIREMLDDGPEETAQRRP